jgi:hypothetical protein
MFLSAPARIKQLLMHTTMAAAKTKRYYHGKMI